MSYKTSLISASYCMAADLWNIFLNVFAAFVYAGIVWLWQKRRGSPPPNPAPSLPTHADLSQPQKVDRRASNRRTFEQAAHRFLFYFVTFAVLYFSVTMPPAFKAFFSKGQVLLSDARFIGETLPSIPIDKSYLQFSFFVVAAALYLPLLALAEFVTSLLHPVIDSFVPVTERIWSAVSMLVFFAICTPVAASSIWLFFEKSYKDAFLTVLLALFMAFAFGQAQRGQR